MSSGDITDTSGPLISVLSPPPQFASPLLQVSTRDNTVLPLELVDLLNQTYFLHVISTEPRKVLPPGKSLLSLLCGRHVQNGSELEGADMVKERVQDIIHRAFWDEAIDSLSDPTPSSQLPRLKRLYDDLYITLSPLLPKVHTVLITLSAPLSPTSSPLLSAITHLREIIVSLRERCAPVRDPYLDQLLHTIESVPPDSSPNALATMVVETVKSILNFADIMKDDLSQFVLGSMTEGQLKGAIVEQAKSHERKLSLELWKLERIQKLWMDWVMETYHVDPNLFEKAPPSRKWVFRLIQSLGSMVAVSCPLPLLQPVPSSDSGYADDVPRGSEGNILPPPLFFSAPSLLYIQNYLQALVISASLLSLVPRSSSDNSLQASDHRASFMTRIWILLKNEIDGEPGLGETKIVNLADEVVQASHQSGTGNFDEQRLRSSVERILHSRDPVFILLQRRLLTALTEFLIKPFEESQPRDTVPDRLRSGTARNVPGRFKHPLVDEAVEVQEVGEIYVKGFEDPVLAKAVKEGVILLKRCIEWSVEVWGDVIQEVI